MSRPLSYWQAILLALVLLGGVALGAVGLFALGSRGSFAFTVRVGFPEVRGIEVGTDVLIHGLKAGEVTAIERNPDDDESPVLLKLGIKGEFRRDVREGSVVRIVAVNAFGTKVVVVDRPVLTGGRRYADLPAVADNALLASEPSRDMEQEVREGIKDIREALKGVKGGQGTIGKLLTDPKAYDSFVNLIESTQRTVQTGKDTMTGIQRGTDALKKVPYIGKYIVDPNALLVRGNAERNRRVFSETELFEKGRAVLTAAGREKLDELGPWLRGLRHPGSEMVVVGYTDPAASGEEKTALTLSRQQADTVAEYLKTKHRAHKLGDWGWMSSTRKVTPLGMGPQKPPLPEKDPLPASRVEVIVFVPQS
jgi:outer membrane protein OmpA-like peptidoglycan-associated protein